MPKRKGRIWNFFEVLPDPKNGLLVKCLKCGDNIVRGSAEASCGILNTSWCQSLAERGGDRDCVIIYNCDYLILYWLLAHLPLPLVSNTTTHHHAATKNVFYVSDSITHHASNSVKEEAGSGPPENARLCGDERRHSLQAWEEGGWG